VLIDEIDKASRDFPNDLLNELDVRRFRVPEVSDKETPELLERTLLPIVIITSNQERNLPEPFLRRCIYFDRIFHGGACNRRPGQAPSDGGAY
jgi:MoxR-like ATPase